MEIPDAVYKIYLTEAAPGKPSVALVFLVPQTGLDFFAELDNRTEAAVLSQPWGLRVVGK